MQLEERTYPAKRSRVHCVILLDTQINLDAPIEAPLLIIAKKDRQTNKNEKQLQSKYKRIEKPIAKPLSQLTTHNPHLPHAP